MTVCWPCRSTSSRSRRSSPSTAAPNSQLGGSNLPAIEWSAGPKLRFVFGLSDLNRARYAEAWLPANLIFDQFSISLEIQITNTMAAHAVITNGVLTSLGLNHWQIAFPHRFSAVSPLLEVRAADTLIQQSDTVSLPVSGKTVTIEAWKPQSSMVDLGAQINNIKNLLAANENDYGPYLHEERLRRLLQRVWRHGVRGRNDRLDGRARARNLSQLVCQGNQSCLPGGWLVG